MESVTQEEAFQLALAGLLHGVESFARRAGEEGEGLDIPRVAPDSREAKIITLARRLSIGEAASPQEEKPSQLLSIFCSLEVEGQKAPARRYWPLHTLQMEREALFPQEASPPSTLEAAYRRLWSAFREDASRLQAAQQDGADLPVHLEGMLRLLQRYAWSIPALGSQAPDVSLYDHSRTTAALAVALAGLDAQAVDDLLAGRRQEEPLLLLIGGDLSGVQNFIYTITAKGAAKGLRGRSFYLQLLTEAIARFVLRELGLPITSLLYAGGGHFYLLAPLTAEAKLPSIRKAISRKLLAHHGGDLYLALGWTEVTAADLSDMGKKWREVSMATQAAKRRRFAEMDQNTLEEHVFGPLGSGGTEASECSVCHFEGLVMREAERNICALCKSLEQLGNDLRDADTLLLGEIEPQSNERKGYAEALAAFGMVVGFDGRFPHPPPAKVKRATLWAMHDVEALIETAQAIARRHGIPVAPGVRYTVNVTPRLSPEDMGTSDFQRYRESLEKDEEEKPPQAGDIKTFSLLQEQSQGIKRLGVLRMDVDDLGNLFAHGLKTDTLSRIVSLSFAFSLFFEGWVGKLCRRINDAGSDKVYAIYSGGDDLFIVGAWNVLPELAHAIHDDLAAFVAEHPAIHISGGLTLHAGKYPLYRAAEDAGEALEQAKELERENGHRKDAFHFLGEVIPWEDFSDIVAKRDELVRMVKPKEEGGMDVNRALLRILIRLYTLYQQAIRERGRPYWGPLMWRSAYFLGRMRQQLEPRGNDTKEEKRRKAEAQSKIKKIQRDLGDSFTAIESWGLAARWAEVLTRKRETV